MRNLALAEVAAVLAEPARASMCLAMIDGRAWTVGELARVAGVAPSTGSEHAAKLVGAGFVESVRQGRHNYLRIADPEVAELIERLAQHAEHRPVEPRRLARSAPGQSSIARSPGLRASLQARRLAAARTCYDHLAGRLGVTLRDGMLRNELIDTSTGIALTPTGRRVLSTLGVQLPAPNGRPVLRDCLDWTERREHLAGSLPAALLAHAIATDWLHRNDDRSVHLHPAATEPLAALGVDVAEFAR